MGRTMSRPQGWDIRLGQLILRSVHKPFAWGEHDCCTFAMEAYEAVMQMPVNSNIKWTNEFEAARYLKEHPIDYWATQWFGCEPDTDWRWARRGDIVELVSPRCFMNSPALGLVVGSVIACPGEFQMQMTRLDEARKVWRIG